LYEGNGSGLVGPGRALSMSYFVKDGGEEPELAGIYLIGPTGRRSGSAYAWRTSSAIM
jgi:hypothetical protein